MYYSIDPLALFTDSLVEEFQGGVAILDRSIGMRGLPRDRPNFVSENGMESDILCAPIGGIVESDMNEPLSLCVAYGRDADFAQNYGSVGGRSASDLDEILLDGEILELGVAELSSASPHAWLMLVPVVPRFDDLGFDLSQNDIERIDGVLLGCMWFSKGELIFGRHDCL